MTNTNFLGNDYFDNDDLSEGEAIANAKAGAEAKAGKHDPDDDLEVSEMPVKAAGGKDRSHVSIPMSKLVLIKKIVDNISENNEKLLGLLSGYIDSEDEQLISIGQLADDSFIRDEAESSSSQGEGRIIEGVFDGENMIGPDGKQYSVPSNYASKSKLVEGDIMKLTITPRGTFVYKQIGPIERTRLIGRLEQDATGNFFALADNQKLRILTASVTYYKGQAGDEVVVLVPKSGESKWAAVENIVKNKI